MSASDNNGVTGRRFLQTTLSTTFAPGTNRKGHVLGGAWTLLLPRLELGHVLCLGVPGPRELGTLGNRADSVTLFCSGAAELRRARRMIADSGLGNVAAVDHVALGAIDVAVVTSPRWARRAAAEDIVGDLLTRAGVTWVELGSPGRLSRGGAALDALVRRRRLGCARLLWLDTQDGEIQRAAGLNDEPAIEVLKATPPGATRGARELGRQLVRRAQGRWPKTEERWGALFAEGEEDGDGMRPPEYVRAIAAASGTPVDDCRVGLQAPPDYPSRKAILFLLPPGTSRPRYVVKLTRDPAFNHRLENEWRALSLLQDAKIPDVDALPRPAFFGEHGGLAVLGETAVAGTPFRGQTSATPDCPLARRATDWLMALGVSTAHRIPDVNAEIPDGLGRLLARFTELYRPGREEQALLAHQLELLADGAARIPLVLQHGDPGTWNLFITDDGRPAFLDWEATEQHGMPLWDLFYFARSVGVTVSRAAGTQPSLKAFADQFLVDGPLCRALAADIDRHCGDIGLDRDLVEPLFFTCWMHRALKESMRLSADSLDRGRYVRLLRLCLEHRDAAGLQRLLGSTAAKAAPWRPRVQVVEGTRPAPI